MADGPNPQNLNNSPSPGGDGVQSAASERSAAGLDKVNQPAQQRINAAERREKAESGEKNAGERPSLIQTPGEVLPGDDLLINAAEQARKDRDAAEHKERAGELLQTTVDEMTAGKKALERNHPGAAKPSNPVDDLDARKRSE